MSGPRPTRFGGRRVITADFDGLIPLDNIPVIPAEHVSYDPTSSGLTAVDVQAALDELAGMTGDGGAGGGGSGVPGLDGVPGPDGPPGPPGAPGAAGADAIGTEFTVNFIIDGGGSVPITGLRGWVQVPVAGTIIAARLVANTSGNAVVDVWKEVYANLPATAADSITASAKPTLASAQKSQDTTLTGWTTTVAAGDWLYFNLDSVATITMLVLALTIRRT